MVCKEVKYLGLIISDDLSDDIDIDTYHQRRKLYAQANILTVNSYIASSVCALLM